MRNRTLIILWAVGFLLHSFAAWNSAGMYYYDEHFQIFEFLNYKLGNISAIHLPWEFAGQLRPWFQPGLYFLVAKIISFFLGRWDPFAVATACRMLSAWLGWGSMLLLWRRYLNPSILGKYSLPAA